MKAAAKRRRRMGEIEVAHRIVVAGMCGSGQVVEGAVGWTTDRMAAAGTVSRTISSCLFIRLISLFLRTQRGINAAHLFLSSSRRRNIASRRCRRCAHLHARRSAASRSAGCGFPCNAAKRINAWRASLRRARCAPRGCSKEERQTRAKRHQRREHKRLLSCVSA